MDGLLCRQGRGPAAADPAQLRPVPGDQGGGARLHPQLALQRGMRSGAHCTDIKIFFCLGAASILYNQL